MEQRSIFFRNNALVWWLGASRSLGRWRSASISRAALLAISCNFGRGAPGSSLSLDSTFNSYKCVPPQYKATVALVRQESHSLLNMLSIHVIRPFVRVGQLEAHFLQTCCSRPYCSHKSPGKTAPSAPCLLGRCNKSLVPTKHHPTLFPVFALSPCLYKYPENSCIGGIFSRPCG